jgi:AraC family ethanolamine operon transcriptional activator
MQTHSFQDFDAFAGSVRGIDCVMLQQNPKHHRWDISQVDLPEIRVQLGRLGSGNIVEGQSWSNGYLVYLPLTDACAYSANGTVLDKGSFAIFDPRCEFCFTTKYEHDWCTIFVPSQIFACGGDLAEPSSGSEKMSCRVSRPNRQVANQFRTLVHQVMTTATHCPQFESSPAATNAAADLLKVASVVVPKGQAGDPTQEGRPKLPRQEIIRRSNELLEERDGEPVLIEDLAAAAKVSERTLRRAFHEYYAVGPVRYLQLRQLHQVYRALRAAQPEAVSVADVLLRHGVWEFSRFAARYRLMFGEIPSETLRRKRR